MTLANLRTPNHFRDYFTHKVGAFLGEQVSFSLPSQEYVDRGNRIKDAGFTTYEPVVFPDLKIEREFVYPSNWKFPLDPWIYKQIASRNLSPNVLTLKQLWGWLDTSVRLDWELDNPMFDKNMDQPLVARLADLRAIGIAMPIHTRHLDPRSAFGVSADEAGTYVYPFLAKTFGVQRGEVRALTAAEFNFVGNLFYPHLGEANSWEWLNDNFSLGGRLVSGSSGSGGLSDVRRFPSGYSNDDLSFRPLVVS